ncbi:MAG: hypothetical protein RI894_2210 [Bacteroidota bacterium]|jgi:NADP-dependent 3-hydroxy acid dehydrogenase YdfG/Tfp pilus assembly protein PilF
MKLFLVYSTENHEAAKHIFDDLARSPFDIVAVTDASPNRAAFLDEMRSNRSSLTLLLLSENFLKAPRNMEGMLSLAQAIEPTGRLVTVLTDNVKAPNATEEPATYRLDLDRSSIVIQYQNFWTDTYLSLRKDKWNVPADRVEDYDRAVVISRNISNEIAAFLRLVRNSGYTPQEILVDNKYRVLYEKGGLSGDVGVINTAYTPQNIVSSPIIDTAPIAEPSSDKRMLDVLDSIAEDQETAEPEQEADVEATVLDAIPGINMLPKLEDVIQHTEKEVEISKVEISKVEIPKVKDLVVNPPIIEKQPEPIAAIVVERIEEIAPPVAESIKTPQPEVVSNIVESSVVVSNIVVSNIVESSVVVSSVAVSNIIEEKTAKTAVPIFVNAPKAVLQTQNTAENAFEKEAAKAVEPSPNRLDLERKLAQSPNDSAVLFAYAKYLYEEDGDSERAKDCLEDAIHHNRKLEEAYLLLGHIIETTDKDSLGAKNYYEKILTINPDNSEAYYRLGRIVHRLFPRQYTISAEYFKRGLELNPNHANMHFLYGKLLAYSFKRYTRARRHYKMAIRLEPTNEQAVLELAKLYQTELSEPERARKYYLDAVLLDNSLHTPEHNTLFDVEAEQVIAMLTPKPKVEKRNVVAFITGATSGIGLATARLLAKNGFRLILNGRRIDRLHALKAELEERYSTEVFLLPFDVRHAQAVFDGVASLPNEWSKIDVLLNNAGLAKGLTPIHEGDINHWNSMIDTNIKGLLYVTRAVAPQMVASKSGHIINVGSLAGKEVYYRGNVYCATKFAVDALTKSMRIDLHTHNVRVSSVSPGHVEETEFALVRFDGNEEKAAIYDDFQPLTARDVAESILFLINTPEHVGIHDIQLASTQQAASTIINRDGRKELKIEEIEQQAVLAGVAK